MKVIIMGCGRVGEQLARLMTDEGHHITVIDQDQAALTRLGPEFRGRKVRGVGFDRDILLKAGIEEADAFAAASSSDNANIVSARIARNVFGVPRVVARLYDPRRAEIYRRLGLYTISSTTWGAERFRELLIHSEFDPEISFGSGEVIMIMMETPQILVGRMVRDLSISGEIIVAAITRDGKALIPISGTEFRERDTLHLVVLTSALGRLKSLVGMEEGG
ncbi:MAG: TrkA family potassium uptake protein [Chloroflexi bacterium]|nr:MAG: TrkA family potassium uptake protein [Chloroflexota bacterium]